MRRLVALALFSTGDLALAGFDPRIAALPALASFLAAAVTLVGATEPATSK